MATAGVTHDLTIATIGFMLWRGRNGRRAYSIVDAQTLNPRVLSMGELTQAEFPPEIQQFWTQEDWRGGIGGLTHRQDPSMLAISVKMDASTRGKLLPARELRVTTIDPADANPDNFKPSGFATVGTEVWSSMGRDVYVWDYTNTRWDIQTEPQAANVTYHNGVEFSGYTYMACWDASDVPTRYIYKADADAQWTLVAASAGNYPKYIVKGKNSAGADLLFGGNFGASATHHLRTSTAAPTIGTSWTSAVAIGDSASAINALVNDGDTVLICKTNGVWAYYADGTQENLTPEFEANAHPNHFKGAMGWNGHVLLPLGQGGMMDFFEGKLYDVSFSKSIPTPVAATQPQLDGVVVAITGNPDAVFVLVQDSANLQFHLLMGKWLDLAGERGFRWHHIGIVTYVTGATVDHCTLFAEGIPSGANVHYRVWVGVESTGSNLLPYFYPLDSDAQEGYTNDTDAYAQTVQFDANLPKVEKTWAKVDFETRNLGAGGRQFAVTYRIDNGSWLTTLTDASGNADGIVDASPTQTMTFPNATTGKILELQIAPKLTNVGTTAAELWNFRVTSQLRPDTLKILPLTLYLADKQRLLNGALRGRPVLDLAQLETWDAQAAEVAVVDARGTSRQMVFLPGRMKVEEMANEALHRPEYRVTTFLVEV